MVSQSIPVEFKYKIQTFVIQSKSAELPEQYTFLFFIQKGTDSHEMFLFDTVNV